MFFLSIVERAQKQQSRWPSLLNAQLTAVASLDSLHIDQLALSEATWIRSQNSTRLNRKSTPTSLKWSNSRLRSLNWRQNLMTNRRSCYKRDKSRRSFRTWSKNSSSSLKRTINTKKWAKKTTANKTMVEKAVLRGMQTRWAWLIIISCSRSLKRVNK